MTIDDKKRSELEARVEACTVKRSSDVLLVPCWINGVHHNDKISATRGVAVHHGAFRDWKNTGMARGTNPLAAQSVVSNPCVADDRRVPTHAPRKCEEVNTRFPC